MHKLLTTTKKKVEKSAIMLYNIAGFNLAPDAEWSRSFHILCAKVIVSGRSIFDIFKQKW